MRLLKSSKKVINEFTDATDYGDIYLIMRVLKKCYEFSKLNSLLLVPIKAPSSYQDLISINKAKNENYW